MKKGRNENGIIYEKDEYINIKNLKTQFREVCKNYKIKDDKLFYIKIIKKRGEDGKFIKTKMDFYVPTIKELNNLLYEFHNKTCHANYKELKNEFYLNKIGYMGMDSMLQDYVNNCPVCVQVTRSEHRLDPIKSINAEGPDNIYEFDISYLNSDMTITFGVKYIFSIMDLFSRKAMIYGLNTKDADSILKLILEFCIHLNFPNKFISDNVPEFKNS